MDLKSDLEETKACTLRIQEKIDKLLLSTRESQCCDQINRLRTDIYNIGSRLDELPNTIDTDIQINPYEQRFQEIQNKMTEMQEKIRSLQTDGGKFDDACASHTSTTSKTIATLNNATSNVSISGQSSQSNTTNTRDPVSTDQRANKGTARRATLDRATIADTGAPVIRQTVKKSMVYDSWTTLAQVALESAQETTGNIECVVSVLLIDVSESMASGEAWVQAKTFVKDFLKGLQEVRSHDDGELKDEYVAVATFGHETKLQMLLTINYDSIQECMDRITLGGPSPLYGGLWMGLAGAMSCKKAIFKNNGIVIAPKIIVVTDCRPTETLLTMGQDVQDREKTDETLVHVISALEELDRRRMSVFVVPVGDYDQDFVNTIRPVDRRLYKYNEGRRLARRQFLSTKTDLIGFPSLLFAHMSILTFSLEDKEDMHDIRVESIQRKGPAISDMYTESTSKTLPQIGSRVRRGPDWHWKNQDHGGPGTIVGHSEEDSQVWVTWDANNETNVYNYGEGRHDVWLTDEPRTAKPGEKIAVGCLVKQGRDGNFQTCHDWTGVVIRVEPPKAHVRWDSGSRGDYSYGGDGKYEIELCTPQPQYQSERRGASVSTQSISKSKPKHKNKNIK